jgi:hypothetical protein
MAIDDYDAAPPSPFSRPGFIASAVLIALIVVAGLIISVANNDDGDSAAAPPPAGPADNPRAGDADTESVCGLDGEETGEARLTSPPDVDQWEYEGLVAYPVHEDYGPGETAKAGYRYCFQHTPEGAVYAAANAAATPENPEIADDWIKYFVSEDAPNRHEILAGAISGDSDDEAEDAAAQTPSETRMSIVGFRLLAYDGGTARVDLALRAVAAGRNIYGSAVYDLVWDDGDWKWLPQNPVDPLRFAQIPSPTGYVVWGEGVSDDG